MWDHRPTADELLDARVRAGWTPTPTSTRDGEVVMGHACKPVLSGVEGLPPRPAAR